MRECSRERKGPRDINDDDSGDGIFTVLGEGQKSAGGIRSERKYLLSILLASSKPLY